MGKTHANLNAPPDLPTAIARCAGHVGALVVKECDALVRAARTLQENYERDRASDETRWRHMVLSIKTGPSLVLQWSQRRRIRRTATGRAWWWDTMPYDAKRRSCPIRTLTADQPPGVAALIARTEAAATQIRQQWHLATRLRITSAALMRLGEQAPIENPWLNTARLHATPKRADQQQVPDSFATTVLMFVSALQDQLLRHASALSQYVEANRTSTSYRLRRNVRGNSLDLAWYHGAAAKRVTVTRRGDANIKRLIAAHGNDAVLIHECEGVAAIIRRAWATSGQLVIRANEIEKLTRTHASKKTGEVAFGPSAGNPEVHPRRSP